MRTAPLRSIVTTLVLLLATAPANAQDPPFSRAQRDLVELAFDAASAVPAYPHAKTRSKLQADGVGACLELGQTALAEQLLARSDADWRQGVGQADLAIALAARGGKEQARAALDRARKLADTVLQDENPQQWRRDRVRARIARAWVVLGDEQQATEFAKGLEPNEAATLARDSADLIKADGLDACLRGVDSTFTVGDFDQVAAALGTCAKLYERCYDDVEHRKQLAQRVRSGYAKLPLQVRLELVCGLVDVALRRGDRQEAKDVAGDLPALMARVDWLPEQRLAWLARIGALRWRAGDEAGGRADLDTAVADYESQRDRIVDMFRAGVLREQAAAWHVLGDDARALAAFRRAVDEGAHNPNARPRAEDLVATCLLIARTGVAPDAGLSARLRAVRAGLRDPW